MKKLEKIGVQLYTIRSAMTTADDIKRSFEKLKKLGYDEVQTAGSPTAKDAEGKVAMTYEEFGKAAKEAGLTIVGTHDNLDAMTADPAQAMANHRLLGTTNMGIGGFFRSTVPEFEAIIQRINAFAKIISKEGFKFTYHNHSHEFMKVDGKTFMERLAEGLDPATTSFVLDTYWVQHGGADVRHWINRLAGRVDILHLKDMGRNGDGPYITEIGNGNIWFEGVIEEALKTGVKHFVVEEDICPGDPFDSLKISSDYLHANFM